MLTHTLADSILICVTKARSAAEKNCDNFMTTVEFAFTLRR